MKAFKNKIAHLKKIMAVGYQARTDIGGPISQQWQEGVMRSIRQIGPHPPSGWRSIDFVQLSWRLAPAALLLMIVLSVYIFQTGTAINTHMTTLSVSEPTTTYLAYLPF